MEISDDWTIQLTIVINFICSKDTDEEHKSDNIEIMINDKTDEVIEELFQSSLSRYQIGLETLMQCSDFIFDFVNLLYCKSHKINPNRGRSYIDSPDCIKNKKTTINLINKIGNKNF